MATGDDGKRGEAVVHPDKWPVIDTSAFRDEAVENRVAEILASMTLEEKVGQIIQGDISSVRPEDLRTYRLGSILNGGNSAPRGDNRAHPSEFLALADAFYEASIDPAGGESAIPVIWGTDAVHGHSNIVGATIFPHNIGLGAARDRELIREIGLVTAREVQVTGMDWTFAPTLAVVLDDRWGRTYEGYSEDPEIVKAYAGAMIDGLQGVHGTDGFLRGDHVLATAKHFVGDGGTVDGLDQGDSQVTEEVMRDSQAAGYPPAIEAGVQTVMASFNSWHGEKLHGHKGLLTDVLRGRMNFDGFVVGDWNGHGQVRGCTNTSCPASLMAGVDMFMAPDSWKGLYENTLEQVKSGEIPMARLDEAVTRILRVKVRYGLFDRGKPSTRPNAGDYSILGAPAHREVARRAVRQSLVLLKNDGGVLPLNPGQRILVAGDGAHNIGKQSGGWTLTWQGEGNANSDFPNGASIYDGLREAIGAAGGEAVLSEDGRYDTAPDAAIVVFGEEPYAEMVGDLEHLDFEDSAALALLRKLKAEGVPTVAVLLSGRPLYVNPEINASDAFVAAWLPGSEGAGVADVLLSQPDGSVNYDFTGKLSFSWPKHPMQTPLNRTDKDYDPLFAYGFGLTYADDVTTPDFDESLDGVCDSEAGAGFMRAGRARAPFRLALSSGGERVIVDGPAASTADRALSVRSVDRNAQEDARELTWSGPAAFEIEGGTVDLSREFNARMAISFSYSVLDAPAGEVRLQLRCASGCEGAQNMTAEFTEAAGAGWRTAEIALDGLGLDSEDLKAIDGLVVESDGAFRLQLSDIAVAMPAGDRLCK